MECSSLKMTIVLLKYPVVCRLGANKELCKKEVTVLHIDLISRDADFCPSHRY